MHQSEGVICHDSSDTEAVLMVGVEEEGEAWKNAVQVGCCLRGLS